MVIIHIVILIDASLTSDNVAKILEYSSYDAHFCLHIPDCVVEILRKNCFDAEEQRSQLVQYWIDYSPYASWSILGGRLLWLKENTALEVAKKFVKTRPGLLYINYC